MLEEKRQRNHKIAFTKISERARRKRMTKVCLVLFIDVFSSVSFHSKRFSFFLPIFFCDCEVRRETQIMTKFDNGNNERKRRKRNRKENGEKEQEKLHKSRKAEN